MKISPVQNKITFGRALRPDETEQFNNVRDEAKKLAGQTGKSIFIVHDACLPQSPGANTGVANLSMKDSVEFFKYMKPYLGFNNVEILPTGQVWGNKGLYCAYAGSALSLGNHEINPQLLTTKEFENLLTEFEYKRIINSNTAADKDEITNYKNVMDDNSPQDKALRKAYERFKTLSEQSNLKKDYKQYVAENNDWLEPKGIYKILIPLHNNIPYFKNWEECIDKHLYDKNYDSKSREKRIKQLVNDNSDEIDFLKFKQFIAEKHLAIGRENLNKMGVKLTGDCEIGFSGDEIWANPQAFKLDHQVGCLEWGLPTLDYDTIKNPESDSAKILKRKVQLCAKRFDNIRFDVGWAYVIPRIFRPDGSSYTHYLGDDVLKFIEKSVLEVKGKNYDLNNLMYEFEGGEIFQQNSDQLLEPVKERVKIFGSTYMHEYDNDIWGSNDAFIKRGWDPDKFVIGIGNHDPQPLKQIAKNIPDNAVPDGQKLHKPDAILPLSRILKLDPKKLEIPEEFAKAKWAEPMMAKNNQMFYIDVFGQEERFDMQCDNLTVHPEKNYARKIPHNYQELYHHAVEDGFGFNIMDALEKVFVAKGLDNTHPELYANIVKFKNILNEKEVKIPETEVTKQKINKNKYTKPIIFALGTAIATGSVIAYINNRKNKTEDEKNFKTTPTLTNKISIDTFIKKTN